MEYLDFAKPMTRGHCDVDSERLPVDQLLPCVYRGKRLQVCRFHYQEMERQKLIDQAVRDVYPFKRSSDGKDRLVAETNVVTFQMATLLFRAIIHRFRHLRRQRRMTVGGNPWPTTK